jgi:hypothetical protein
MPYTLSVDPKRTKLRSDSVEPSATKSSTLKLLPSRVTPKVEIVLPSCRKLRRERVDPKLTKSSALSDDPKRVSPYVLKQLPRRM